MSTRSVPAAVVAALPDVVRELLCVVADDGTISWAGPAWERELGHRPADLVDTCLGDLIHPDDRERFVAELQRVGAGVASRGLQCRVASAGDAVHWIEWSGTPAPEGAVLSGRDVTALRDPDRQRAELVASALDAIVTIDAHDRIVEFNPSAERIFGHAREQALGSSLSELLVPAAMRKAHKEGVSRVAGGVPFKLLGKRLELSAQRADGTEFPAELTITQTSAEPFRVTAFVRDLSAQHAAQAAWQESEQRYAQAFDQAPVGIALVSISPVHPGLLLQVNDSLCRMMGRSEEELLAGTYADFTHPDDLAANQELFAEVVAGKRSSYELEKRFIRKDGSVVWAHVQGTLLRDAEGTPLYGLGQVQDITVRKEAEIALRTSEARLLRTERLARIGAWEWDLATDRFSWSRGLDDVFGRPDSAAAPTREAFLAIVHRDDRDRVAHIIAAAFDSKGEQTWEYRVHRGGSLFHIYAWGEVVVDEHGRPTALRGYAQDVSQRRLAEERAEELLRDTDRILDSAGEGIFRVGADGATTYVNPAASRVLGYAQADLLGRPLHDVIHHSHRDGSPHAAEECPVRLTIESGIQRRITDDVLWHRDGHPIPVEYTSAPIFDGDEIAGAVVVFADVTERRELEDRLRTQAESDDLTGLTNRRHFEELLAEHLADRRRAEGALLLLDLDHFKLVNDSFGHAAGDDLIRTLAGVLRGRLRDEDLLARLGGDEFAVLLPGADEQEAEVVARRLVAGVEAARPAEQQVGASVGVACFSAGTEATAGDLLVAADIALYEAKDRGRGCVAVFAGQPGRSLSWVQRIRRALDEDRFVLYAQPIVDLATGEAVQEELLLRMIDDDGSVVPPAQFLPTAETFGLIGAIDRWVLSRGVALAAAGRRVHVNLSGRSIGSESLLDALADHLEEAGADPSLLVVELTETAAVTNMTAAQAFVERVRGLGCRMALDDFGTGFGSFTYLQKLSADYLKIDMEFVRELTTNPADLRVVESLVHVAASFGLQTVAEGVEDEATLRLLRDVGVGYAQGYHLGRPAPSG